MTQGFESFLSTTQYIYNIFFSKFQEIFRKKLKFYVKYDNINVSIVLETNKPHNLEVSDLQENSRR